MGGLFYHANLATHAPSVSNIEALDEFLPGIVLAQIASFLKLTDLNSLLMTSRTVYSKLNGHRFWLAKPEVMQIHYTKDCLEAQDAIYVKTSKKMRDLGRETKNNLWLLPYHNPLGLLSIDRPHYLDIERMYHDRNVKRFENTPVLHFGSSLSDVLSCHARFAFSRANIHTLKLENLKDQELSFIANERRETKSRVEVLHVETTTPIGHSLMDLISKATTTLYVYMNSYNSVLSEDFFNCSKIYKLRYIHISVLSKRVISLEHINLRDEDLAAMRARVVRINAITMVTPRQVIEVINEWLRYQRELESIMIGVDSTYTTKEWIKKLSSAKGAKVEKEGSGKKGDPRVRKVVVRRSDNRVLRVYCKSNRIEIFVAFGPKK